MGSLRSSLARTANSFKAEIAFSADGVFSRLQRLSSLFRKNRNENKQLKTLVKYGQIREKPGMNILSASAGDLRWLTMCSVASAAMSREVLSGGAATSRALYLRC
ncbi:hypothetical protein TNCV_648341 [Trichonephila clavipes]|uniref:Uncharacterized protein n=1 Tax=Trichonephila clavipes TaxID=2585209 RepID=A0A8X6SMD1_TRICX|nr:hypothetical protein TNCV_648341 [Trichonephila clavipes]